ncbi:MAG: hypothetical protein EOQ40_10790 [Mesorhizobium sp.]|nr:MAG: hypothetical protein EOQ40_10790 [Mesorhizobium sp.]
MTAWRATARRREVGTSLEHPSSVSALRADPPSPTRGEGKTAPALQPMVDAGHLLSRTRQAPPSPLVGEGGRTKLGRMRGAPAW